MVSNLINPPVPPISHPLEWKKRVYIFWCIVISSNHSPCKQACLCVCGSRRSFDL